MLNWLLGRKLEADPNISEMIDALPGPQGEFLRMHYEEGLTYTGIAERFGMDPRFVLDQISIAYSSMRLQTMVVDDEPPKKKWTDPLKVWFVYYWTRRRWLFR